MRSWKALALVSISCLALAQPSPSRVPEDFKNPAKAYRPVVRWWWPGGDVTDQELRREIRLLDEASFGGGEIQPFLIGLNPKMAPEALHRVNDYLTPAFFSHVSAALDEARSRGMWLDYSGDEEVTPELASLELRHGRQAAHGPAHFLAPGARGVDIDLGSVGDAAEIKVNGKPVVPLLLRPYRADITGLVHPGANSLEILVTNTLYNSLAARNSPAEVPGLPRSNSTLMPSGLMGPVTVEVSR